MPDLAGGLRGKWITRNKLEKAFNGGLKLPVSTLAFDVWGRDPEEWVFQSGDADGVCAGDIRTLAASPWLKRPTGQLLASINDVDGSLCGYDPRNIVQALMTRFDALGLTPVLASEMEFSLFKGVDQVTGVPNHSQAAISEGLLHAGQTYGLEAMDDVSELMHDIRDAAEIQNLAVDTLIKEAGQSQYEINLLHCDNALQAADHALMLRRVIKGVAKSHGLSASFMAKPFGDQAGNGMHIHCSLLNADGNNAFNNGTDQGNELLRQAVAGCLEGMRDSMLLFAPNLNSYRRFQPGNHAPLSPSWGYENRTTSVRIPADKQEAMRLEHRVSGADANIYLVVAGVLAGMLQGIERTLDAPDAVTGNAYDLFPPSLPRYWPDALACFKESAFIKDYLGGEFQSAFAGLKQQEMETFDQLVTPLEYRCGI